MGLLACGVGQAEPQAASLLELQAPVCINAWSPRPKLTHPCPAPHTPQAMRAGDELRAQMDVAHEGRPYSVYFYTSPYLRSRQVRQRVGRVP